MTDRTDLKREILDFLNRRPGSSTSAVRRAVPGRASRVRAALEELEEAGEVRNAGNGRAHAWRRCGASERAFGEAPEQLPDVFPDVVGGLKVHLWATPAETAAALSTTPRTVRRWEDRGLPSAGSGGSKRYPFPQTAIWRAEFEIKKGREKGRTDLSIELAVARDRLFQIRQFGECGHVVAG